MSVLLEWAAVKSFLVLLVLPHPQFPRGIARSIRGHGFNSTACVCHNFPRAALAAVPSGNPAQARRSAREEEYPFGPAHVGLDARPEQAGVRGSPRGSVLVELARVQEELEK